MRVIVVGYGVQGKKRLHVADHDAVGVVDLVATEANWREIHEVPLDKYDAALVCTPDAPKMALLGGLACGHWREADLAALAPTAMRVASPRKDAALDARYARFIDLYGRVRSWFPAAR